MFDETTELIVVGIVFLIALINAIVIIPYFVIKKLMKVDPANSPLFQKLGNAFITMFVRWAIDKNNEAKLNALMKRLWSLPSTGEALGLIFDEAKLRIKQMFGGLYGASKTNLNKEISANIPEHLQKIMDHPIFDKIMTFVEYAEILKQFKKKRPEFE